MASRNSRRTERRVVSRRTAARNKTNRFAERGESQLVRLLLLPGEPSLVSVNTEPQIVFITNGYLARPQHALRAAREAQQQMRIIIQPASLNESREIGAQRFEFQVADKTCQVISMRSDVPNTAARA